MRRKLFCTLVTVMAILFFMDFLGLPLRQNGLDVLTGTEADFTGKIVRIQNEGDGKYRFEVKIKTVNGNDVHFKENLLLSYSGNLEEPWKYFNETICFFTEINEPAGQRNPHCFDYRKYLKSRGISAVAAVKEFTSVPGKLTFKEEYEKWLFRQRCLFEETLSPETKGLIIGVLFGDTSCLDEETYQDFRNNGTAHILAVSGLHVGILYGLYKKVAGRRSSRAGLILLGAMLFSYGVLSMWSPSVIRATLMIAMSITAALLDLRYDMLTAMSAVGLILIASDPYVIFGAGFQMSFLAITSIAFIQPVIPDKVPDWLTAALAVNIGLLPYQIYQFNYISIISVAANIPIVFLTGYFVPVSLSAFLIFIFFGDFTLMKPVVEGMAFMITQINELSTLNGYGAVEVVRPPLWIVLAAGGFIFFLSSETFTLMKIRQEYKKILLCICGIMVTVAVCQYFTYSPITHDDIVFVDVGQGDCIHLRDGNKDVLIDGGGSISCNVGKTVLKPYLLRNGASDLDVVLVTHEHMDHYKGIEELAEEFKIEKILTRLTSGQVIQVSDNVRIETLWPVTIDPEKGQEENSQCSVFMIHYKSCRILITGDLDETGERAMMAAYKGTGKLKADILKIGHHGSRTSTCQEFLDEVDPDYAVIQVGKNNYGHPTNEVVEKIHNSDIILFRNDYNGAVGFSVGNGKIKGHTLIDRKD